jgi:subtilisin family serine protease
VTNRRIMIALLALGAVLIIAAGVVYLVTSRGRSPSPPEITPPASLAELAEQYPDLAPILTDAELGSVYKQFLLAYQEGGQEAALELARQRGLLTPDGDMRVNLLLDTDDHAPLVAQLEATGVTIISAYRNQVDLAVPIALVEAQLQTEDPGAIFTQLTELEHVIAVRLPEQRVREGSAIDGEGVGVIGADTWQQAGFTGAGLRIGILDLSFSGYENLLGAELPDEVTVETFGSIDFDDPDPHGVACAEIVHEIAPDAQLFFAWYDGYDAAFGEAVSWLQAQGVDIISHSANGYKGPFDGSAWDSQEVDGLSAQGILWVNSAGNEALSHHRSTFTDEDGDGFHEFTPGEEMLALYNNGYVQVVLNWDDDWTQATQDYELFLYDAAGNELAASQDAQTGEFGNEPVEGILYETGGETVYAVIVAYEVDRAVTFDLFVGGAEVAYPSPDFSVCSPADAVTALTVGAVNWWDDSLASYSSQGPTSDGRLKPEISAPTSVSGASYGGAAAYDEYAGFNGTSAACPHVAGTAALVWQAHPEFSREEVVDFLLTHAIDLGLTGPDTGFGYGRLQLPSPPAESPAPPPAAATPTPPPAAGPTATPVPVPTPTLVAYVTPAPVPPSGAGAGVLEVGTLGLIMGGLGCAGAGLLVCGGIGLLIVGRRARRSQPAPVPSAAPYAPQYPPYPAAPRVPPPRRTPPPPARRAPSAPPAAQPPRCPSCGAATLPGARFCSKCGRPVASGVGPRTCPHCGARLREGASFCTRCGKRVQ